MSVAGAAAATAIAEDYARAARSLHSAPWDRPTLSTRLLRRRVAYLTGLLTPGTQERIILPYNPRRARPARTVPRPTHHRTAAHCTSLAHGFLAAVAAARIIDGG